jgi:hypothetical protein
MHPLETYQTVIRSYITAFSQSLVFPLASLPVFCIHFVWCAHLCPLYYTVRCILYLGNVKGSLIIYFSAEIFIRKVSTKFPKLFQ